MPVYRATGDEQHLTRGRANTLRLALSGQLGPDALASDEMRETMALCISCKGCKRECPTGVDMARMKIEFCTTRSAHGLSLRDRLIAYLPRYAPYAARVAPLLNLRNRMPTLRRWASGCSGFSARRNTAALASPIVARARAAVVGRAPDGAGRSCCSSTPSTAISSRKMSVPPSAC